MGNPKLTMRFAAALLTGGLAIATTAAPAAVDAQQSLRQGRLQLRMGQPDRAIELLTAAVRATPNNADARLWLGRALMAKGDANNAKRELEFAVRLAPDDADPYVALARAYRALGLVDAVEDTGRRLLARGHPRGHWIMGRALRDRRRHDAALAAFDTYFAAAPGASAAERGAVEAYRQALAAAPSGGEEANDMVSWAKNPNLSAAHRMAYDAFLAIAKVSESQRQGSWPYWMSHYDPLARQYYPLIAQARSRAAAAAPRTALVRGLHDRYVAIVDELDRVYRGFLDGVRQQNPESFLWARGRIPELGEAFEDLIDDVDDASEDLADRD